ncbi:MAG: phosphodiester glycosidase family protein [Caenibius sp.]
MAATSLAALAACSATSDSNAAERPTEVEKATTVSACKPVVFEQSPLTVCEAIPTRHTIKLALGPKEGAPYRSLAAYAAARPADAPLVAFAMNGGMFDEAGQPIGYYVENGERLHKLNRNAGPGNFHLMPNGVFYGSKAKWEIRTSDDFYRNVDDRPAFGTQSGPMLVINGKLHPKIADNGTSRHIRNAVGIDKRGHAWFVMSESPVSFGRFARYFCDELKATDALFLDGSVSALWDPARGRLDLGAPLGPLIVVEQSEKARP